MFSQEPHDPRSSDGRATAGVGPDWPVSPVWEDLRQIAEELGPRIHLAGPDARDRWHALQPRLAELERLQARAGEHAREIAQRKLATAAARLLRLRDDIVYAAG